METKKTNLKKFWNWGKTKNEGKEIRTLYLNGVIASEGWFDDDITPKKFKTELWYLFIIPKFNINLNTINNATTKITVET